MQNQKVKEKEVCFGSRCLKSKGGHSCSLQHGDLLKMEYHGFIGGMIGSMNCKRIVNSLVSGAMLLGGYSVDVGPGFRTMHGRPKIVILLNQ